MLPGAASERTKSLADEDSRRGNHMLSALMEPVSRRRWLWAAALLTALSLLLGTVAYGQALSPTTPVELERPDRNDLPDQVREWLDNVHTIQGIHRLDYDGKTWVVVAWGTKPTGGYSVQIEEAERNDFGVTVLSVRLRAPEPGEPVTLALTHPYDLVAMDQTSDAFAAEFEGAPWLPDEFEGIPNASSRVFIQEPAPGARVGSRVTVKGAAMLFEGAYQVVVEDGHNQLANEIGTATAGGPEWGKIEIELELDEPSSPNGMVIIMWQDAATGDIIEEVAVPVSFEEFSPVDHDPGEPAFSDVEGHWAEEQVDEAVSRGFVNGYPDGSFRPDGTVTRAEFLKMLLAGLGIEPDDAGDLPFPDAADHWARGYAAQALELGIIEDGDYDGLWQPDRNITRLEMATQVVRALDAAGDIDAHAPAARFSDTGDLNRTELGYIGQAVNLGILRGYPDGTVAPHGESTRAEAVVVILRALAARDNG